MSCTTVREQLHTLSDGERLGSWRATGALISHCVRCAECRTVFWQLRRLRKTTRHLPQTLAVPATMRGRVLGHLPITSTPQETLRASQKQYEASFQHQMKIRRRIVLAVALGLPLSASIYAVKNPSKVIALLQEDEAKDDPKQNAAFVRRIQELREIWKPWAMNHRADLAEMLKEKGMQRAAHDRVKKALPQKLTRINNVAFTREDLDKPDLPFAYLPQMQGGGKEMNPHRNTSGKGELRGISHGPTDPTVKKIRDIEILCSLKSGTLYTFWASGRITEKTRIKIKLDSPPYVLSIYKDSREIAPPYEELTR